ncbi:MAG TPA: hypothetical protein VF527_06035 [Pyrinomonadaceae bacterium]|jgi:hypothetical protein
MHKKPSASTVRKSADGECARAARRGLEFIYAATCEPEHFAVYGSDLLNCFYFIAETSRDAILSRTARRMGRERARRWRRERPALPPDADAHMILDYIHGSHAADCLGLGDPQLKQQLARAAVRFNARDYLSFDPLTEPPPSDVPAECGGCGSWNERGRKRCRECRKALTQLSRYVVWYDALTRTYTGECYGVTASGRFRDVFRWLPAMRPYRGREEGRNPDWYDAVYAVTHIVYTLNDYDRYQLSPRWLPAEFAFMKESLGEAIATDDAEMAGEIIDALKAFKLDDGHALIRAGTDYLLASQNADGSWGDPEATWIYARYHPTWTAIDGLRAHVWRGTRLRFPEVKPFLLRLNRDARPFDDAQHRPHQPPEHERDFRVAEVVVDE